MKLWEYESGRKLQSCDLRDDAAEPDGQKVTRVFVCSDQLAQRLNQANHVCKRLKMVTCCFIQVTAEETLLVQLNLFYTCP